MPTEPDTPESSVRNGGVGTTAPEPRRRRTGRNGAPRLPAPTAAPAAIGAAATATRAAPTAPPPQSPSPATTSTPTSASANTAAYGAAAPMAAAAMGALASMAAQYGSNTPDPDTGQPNSPPAVPIWRPSGPMAWDSAVHSAYSADNQGKSGQVSAMGRLNADLSRLLGGSADSTTAGRARLAAIIAETDAALTALGSVSDTAVGQRQVMNTLDAALQRAGVVLGQGQAGSALTAEQVSALADRYAQDSRATPQRRVVHRRSYIGGSGGPPLTQPSGNERIWIDEAARVLEANGYSPGQLDQAAIATIIQHESGGNPHAINLWDSNAEAGHPSKGLMQTIDPTFDAWALPGHHNVWNPVDNIIAGVRYAIHRYGSMSNVPGIVQLRHGGSYVGY
ncbi:transglycosylase SLT domain-containing protein [Nocardia vaccinii]|uniref:transglycosylase SLT domain-containing protein n=1 Tax=Nocardia vaccinii TaxID=1822 RepID=UPI000A8C5DD1|nr:transglycosylase SLT domain-containing protein [Nocardia vaccinii]